MFRGLKEFNLPEIEEKVLKFWAEHKIFEKSVERRKPLDAARGKESKNKVFRFFEGPPTANGRPAIHHVLARAFKDIVLRYKTMHGYYVPRRAGWDTHGLPVELEIEKELGITSKPEIEKFGIAAFNERAKASVWKYKDEWEKLTSRVGMWLDFKNPYITYDNSYIESLWWIFSEFAKKKLLKKSYKIVPWCPRCETTLSSHELAQPGAYRLTKDPSVFVKFRLSAKRKAQSAKVYLRSARRLAISDLPEYLLVWTTTPWTLPANVAVAVNPKLTYTKFKVGDEYLWSYSVPPTVNGVIPEVVEKILGKKMVGLQYEPLYAADRTSQVAKRFYQVLAADFVDTETGTGCVHIAPAFGEDDFQLTDKTWKLKSDFIPLTIDDQGHVASGFPGAGKFIKTADRDIVADLRTRGLIYQEGVIEHDYPFCWRCSAPLIYFARSSWFVEMSRLREELMARNAEINWIPAHIKEGRFGEWIREVKDWAISRARYWGTPLPIWECVKCSALRIVSGLRDLDEYNFSSNTFFILRHGEATHNLSDTIASGIERPKTRSTLTKKGIADLEVIAKKIKKEKIDLIIASPYYRTQQTAKIIADIARIKTIISHDGLRELDCGVFNGRPVQEHRDFFKGNQVVEFTKAPPSGESLQDVKTRMMATLLEINQQYEGRRILFISHGDPLWILEGAVQNIKNEDLVKLDYIQLAEYRALSLHNFPYNRLGELDVHRPYIDQVFLRCEKCRGGKMRRIKDVADVWFDSGGMPFAQWHYPFEHRDLVDEGHQYPADYIVEGMDQTRGWFYTLLAVATALGRPVPYCTVISLGLLLDKHGTKMSKSKGNVVDPWACFSKYGADVVRWHFYTINPPGEPKRFDEMDLLKVSRRFFAIVYNSFVFLETYGAKLSSKLNTAHLRPAHILDRWVIARVHVLTREVTDLLDRFDIGEAARRIELFVDDLSRWYIRRSRRRFQQPEAYDLAEGTATLKFVLGTLAQLTAPFAPFFSEALYRSLHGDDKNNENLSVHCTDWPTIDESHIDNALLLGMEEVRRLANLALAARAAAGVKVRQPLASLKIRNSCLPAGQVKSLPAGRVGEIRKELLDILADEVNVKEVIYSSNLKEEIELDTTISEVLREEGTIREFARMVQDLRAKAGYRAGEGAKLAVEVSAPLRAVLERHLVVLQRQTAMTEVEFKRITKFNVELETDFDGEKIWVAVRR